MKQISESRQNQLIVALRDPDRYPHPAGDVDHLETHISHVLLAGDFAYKVKKPVNFGFLDFSTLQARRFYCDEELRLNQRAAPRLYLDVVPITGTTDLPILGGSGPAIEYALRMRRFSQAGLFSRMLDRGELAAVEIDSLAAVIATFHGKVPMAEEGSPFGEPQVIERRALENFEQLAPLLKTQSEKVLLDAVRVYTVEAHTLLEETFKERKRQGFVRECHGDLHLDNIVCLDGEITLFDCIEFSEELRWIDVMSEVAFVMMDLCARGHTGLAFRLLNAYLERTGDYGGLSVLCYYLVYRALVRAKVMALRACQLGSNVAGEAHNIRSYLRLAQRFPKAAHPAVVITHGVSGSGKSTLAQRLLQQLGAIRLRSDVERKRLFGLASAARTGSVLDRGLYSREASHDTYEELARLARLIVKAGYPVIVDAAFLERRQRDRFRQLAAAMNVPFAILDCQAPAGVLRARVAERERRGRDPSEANLAVLEHQLATREPLESDEQSSVIGFGYREPADSNAFDRSYQLLKTRISET